MTVLSNDVRVAEPEPRLAHTENTDLARSVELDERVARLDIQSARLAALEERVDAMDAHLASQLAHSQQAAHIEMARLRRQQASIDKQLHTIITLVNRHPTAFSADERAYLGRLFAQVGQPGNGGFNPTAGPRVLPPPSSGAGPW